MNRAWLICCSIGIAMAWRAVAVAQSEPVATPLSVGQAPIDYYGPASDDTFAGLMRDVASGAKTIPFDNDTGYLRGLLAALEIPIESQTLVFSKTSVQNQRIGPATPRAVYFGDEASIGYIPGAPTLELLAQDPVKGSLFYVVPQTREEFRPRREEQCTTCHIGTRTRGVPGWLVHSVETDERGRPVSGLALLLESTSFAKRFGGWYVTGSTEGFMHRGNQRGGKAADVAALADLSKYPSSHSDLVAQLVLHHQTHGYNLMLRAGQAARLGRPVDVLDELVRCLLLIDIPALPAPIGGQSEFVKVYVARGLRDGEGRSLRDLDLQTRLFCWHASPLVLTRTFRRLPDDLRNDVCERMTRLLDGRDAWPGTPPPESERRTTLAILHATAWVQ